MSYTKKANQNTDELSRVKFHLSLLLAICRYVISFVIYILAINQLLKKNKTISFSFFPISFKNPNYSVDSLQIQPFFFY